MKDIIFSIFPFSLILGSFKNDCKSLIISILPPSPPHTCYKYILIHINISVGIYFLVPTILGLFRKGIHSLELAQSLMLSLFCSGELGSGLRLTFQYPLYSSDNNPFHQIFQGRGNWIFGFSINPFSNYRVLSKSDSIFEIMTKYFKIRFCGIKKSNNSSGSIYEILQPSI